MLPLDRNFVKNAGIAAIGDCSFSSPDVLRITFFNENRKVIDCFQINKDDFFIKSGNASKFVMGLIESRNTEGVFCIKFEATN